MFKFNFRSFSLWFIIYLNIILSILLYFYTKDFSVGKRVITNGDKTIVFQGMMHRAMPHFYDVVFGDLKRYQQEGYVFYREGVKDAKIKENFMKFSNFYRTFKTCNTFHKDSMMEMVPQKKYENILFFEEYSKGKLVDLSIDNLAQYLPEDKWLKPVEDSDMKVCIQYERKLFNFTMNLKEYMMKPEKFDDVILKPRDMHLAMTLMASNDKKIYVQYGDAHWEGVWEILKDNNYELIEESELYPLK